MSKFSPKLFVMSLLSTIVIGSVYIIYHSQSLQTRQRMRRKRLPIFEVCVGDIESALEAVTGGATQIELCANLCEGGTTPSYGTIKQVTNAVKSRCRVHVIIRSRGGDFVYSFEEIQAMLYDIKIAKSLGADGVVIGALDSKGNIDIKSIKLMINAARPMSVTFHRAFDVCKDTLSTAQCLVDLGVDYLLTSGQAWSAVDGISIIRQVQQNFGDNLCILVGGGVNSSNARYILEQTGAQGVHMSSACTVEESVNETNPVAKSMYKRNKTISQKVAQVIKKLYEEN